MFGIGGARNAANQAMTGLGGLGKTAQGVANTNIGRQTGAFQQGGGLVNTMTNESGGLSPLVSKQLANQEGMIGKTYSGIAGAGLRGLAARGMGAAPTGAAASIANTAARQTGEDQTGAIGRAFGTQNDLNLAGLNYLQNQQQIYNPVPAINAGTGAYEGESNAAANRSKLGSTFGDIMKFGGAALGAIPGLGRIGTIGSKLASAAAS